MTSVGIQADPNDPEGVLGIVRSFQSQLQELAGISTTLTELNAHRGQSIQRCESLSENLEGKIQDLVESAGHMETILRENQQRHENGDKELEELTNRKEHLDSEIRRLQGEIGENIPTDMDAALRFTGFDLEELYGKMDDLSFLHDRLDRANKNMQQEWKEYKEDLRSSQSSMQPFLEAKDHLDELTLARYLGMQSRKDDGSERELAERLCEHHENRKRHRQLEQQLMESEMWSRDLDNEIGSLFAEKRDLWRRCLDLENFLYGISGDGECELLRPSCGYADITEVVEGRPPTQEDSDEDLDDDLEVEHGRFLHRCPKNTSIAIFEDDSDANDVVDETTRDDTEETEDSRPSTHVAVNVGNVAEFFHQDEENSPEEEVEEETQPNDDIVSFEDIELEPKNDTAIENDVTATDTEAKNSLNVTEDGIEPHSDKSILSMEARQDTRFVGGRHEQPTTIMMKFRQRFGIRNASSSVKIRSTGKKTGLTATGSLRSLGKGNIFRRKR